jgi:transglutaminase-like putative cysteine protease
MNFLKKAILLLIVLVGLSFWSGQQATQALAQEKPNFAVDLETTYDVLISGDTKVTHHFKIRNLNPTLFIKQYGLKLSSTEIDNPVARSNAGEEISTEIVSTNNQTSIGITFPDQVVGQNKARDFTITYTNPDIATINGQVLEVAIPRQANPEEFNTHSVKIITPLAFGNPTKTRPEAFKTKLINSRKNIETSFTDLKGEGVSLIFGHNQIFELDLRYSLENPTNQKKITQIALPPDTPYQRLNYRSLEPIPDDLHLDVDGNWIATYRLEPNSATIVSANLQVQLTLEPDPAIPFMSPDESLISSQKYWPAQNQTITELASDFPDIKSAYDYVVNTLKYDFDNIDAEVERLGALEALKKPDQVLCQEFTDLFVSLVRAKEVPARRVTGYSHTQNDILRPLSLANDILHSWPEYFDAEKNFWIPVDPTWENTSGGVDYFNQFDLNHIVFAINGTSSTTPFPAGSYKLEGENSKDIQVKFANQFLSVAPNFEFKTKAKNIFGLLLPGSTKLYIFNRTGQAHYNLDLKLMVENSEIEIFPNSPHLLKSILPFQKKEIKIKAYQKGVFWPKKDLLTLQYETKTVTVPITVSPSFWRGFESPYIPLALGTSLTTLALGAGSLLVLWKRWRNSLRRQGKKTKK